VLLAATLFFAVPARAADDGYLVQITSATINCPLGTSVEFVGPVNVNYPAGAALYSELDDTGSGFDIPVNISGLLVPGGFSGIGSTGPVSVAQTPATGVTFRITLTVGGNPTYRQTFSVTCGEPSTLTILGEDFFPTADPPPTIPDAPVIGAVVATPNVTG